MTKKAKRTRGRWFVVTVEASFDRKKELLEYLETRDKIPRVVFGTEKKAEKKMVPKLDVR